MEGETRGVEMWAVYQPLPTWRLRGGLTLLDERLRLKPGSNDFSAPLAQEGRDPDRTWTIGSSLDLPNRVELDLRMRHVSALASASVPAYYAVDARLGWKISRNLELSLTGQNLFDGGHAEFTDPVTRTEFERSVFFKVLSRF
jgi:iron complex outermembrane receptor protein